MSLVSGDVDGALDYLEAALAERDPVLPYLRAVPRWRQRHGIPRFNAVYKAMYPNEEPPA